MEARHMPELLMSAALAAPLLVTAVALWLLVRPASAADPEAEPEEA